MDVDTFYNHLIKYKSRVFQSAESLKNALSTIQDTGVLKTLDQWRSFKEKLAQLSSLPKTTLANYDYDGKGTGQRSFLSEDFLPDSTIQLKPLPASALEVESIATLLKSKGYLVQTLLDTAATETNIL